MKILFQYLILQSLSDTNSIYPTLGQTKADLNSYQLSRMRVSTLMDLILFLQRKSLHLEQV